MQISGSDTELSNGQLLHLRLPINKISYRSAIKWSLRSGLFWLISLSILWWIFSGFSIMTKLITTAIVILIFLIYPLTNLLTYRWEVTENALYTSYGLIVRKTKVIPKEQIQWCQHKHNSLFTLSELEIHIMSRKGKITLVGLNQSEINNLITNLTNRNIELDE